MEVSRFITMEKKRFIPIYSDKYTYSDCSKLVPIILLLFLIVSGKILK